MYKITEYLSKRIDNAFKYHPPKEHQVKRYEKLREKHRELALLISELTPSSSEQERAIEKLEECSMLANAAIARHE